MPKPNKPKYPKLLRIDGVWKRRQAAWEKLFEETGDIRYAVLAIGRVQAISSAYNRPIDFPGWAFTACSEFFEWYDKSYFDPINSKSQGTQGYINDDDLLDDMASLMLTAINEETGKKFTVNSAAEAVLAEKKPTKKQEKIPEPSDIRRLTKKWNDEWGSPKLKNDENEWHPRELRQLRLKKQFLYPHQA